MQSAMVVVRIQDGLIEHSRADRIRSSTSDVHNGEVPDIYGRPEYLTGTFSPKMSFWPAFLSCLAMGCMKEQVEACIGESKKRNASRE
jgi:hypothetical protein